MKIQKNNSRNKKPVIIAIVILIVLGALGGLLIWKNLRADDEEEENVPQQQTTIPSDETPVDVPTSSTPNREAGKEPIQNDAANVDQSTLSAYITAKNIVDGTLQIRVQISQYLTSGNCRITIGAYSASANIVQNPSSSSCAGWDIPVAQIGSGHQVVSINITSGDKSTTITDEVSL